MPPHPLTNFEIQKCYHNEPRFNGVYYRNNLPKKMKDGAYVIKLWIGLPYLVTVVKFFILIVLVLNMFRRRLKDLLGMKT